MRTTIDINEELLREAQHLTAIHKKKELVERSLEELIRQQRLERLANRIGKTSLRLNLQTLGRMRRHA